MARQRKRPAAWRDRAGKWRDRYGRFARTRALARQASKHPPRREKSGRIKPRDAQSDAIDALATILTNQTSSEWLGSIHDEPRGPVFMVEAGRYVDLKIPDTARALSKWQKTNHFKAVSAVKNVQVVVGFVSIEDEPEERERDFRTTSPRARMSAAVTDSIHVLDHIWKTPSRDVLRIQSIEFRSLVNDIRGEASHENRRGIRHRDPKLGRFRAGRNQVRGR